MEAVCTHSIMQYQHTHTDCIICHRLIKHSAPHMNGTVIFGCIVMLLGSLLLGIDSNNPAVGVVDVFHSHFAAICTVMFSLNPQIA